MKIARRCRQCDQVYIFDVKSDDYIKYLNGLAVRKAFPYLSSAERAVYHPYMRVML
jgi:hypothetical protein